MTSWLNRQSGNPTRAIGLALAGPVVLTVALLFLRARDDTSAGLRPIQVSSGEWAPYSSQTLPRQGLAAALLTAALREHGHEPAYLFMPWPHAMSAAERNESRTGVRGAFPVYYSEARAERWYYSQPLLTVEMVLFYRAEDAERIQASRTVADLADFTVVFVREDYYPEELRAALPRQEVVTTTREAFRRLVEAGGRILVPEALEVGLRSLRELPMAGGARVLHSSETALSWPQSAHFVASRRNPHNAALIRGVDTALAGLRESGRYDEIVGEVLRQIDVDRTVRLQPIAGEALIVASTLQGERVVLPRGTPAVVEQWGAAFLPGPVVRPDAPALEVRARILRGPMTGRVVLVDGRAVEVPREKADGS
jgi:polar amino acid transport system substrate-binding protein